MKGKKGYFHGLNKMGPGLGVPITTMHPAWLSGCMNTISRVWGGKVAGWVIDIAAYRAQALTGWGNAFEWNHADSFLTHSLQSLVCKLIDKNVELTCSASVF